MSKSSSAAVADENSPLAVVSSLGICSRRPAVRRQQAAPPTLANAHRLPIY